MMDWQIIFELYVKAELMLMIYLYCTCFCGLITDYIFLNPVFGGFNF